MKQPPGQCQDCGSEALTWGSAICCSSGVVDGRHRIGELSVVVYLGCDECCCTVYSEPIERLLARLNGVGVSDG